MDDIKENAFGIFVAILVVGLLVFLYFWVLGPVFGQITDIGKTMETTDLELTGFLATDPKPSQELVDARTEHQELLKTALEDAESFYATKYQRFNEFLPGTDENQAPGQFKATFTTEIKKLKEKYMEVVPASTEGEDGGNNSTTDTNGEGMPFTVEEMDILTQDDVKLAMKHFWIIEEILTKLHARQLGGLKSINFYKQKKRGDLPTPASYEPIRVDLVMEMPPDQIRTFLIDLYVSDRVPFIEVESLKITRDPLTIIEKLIVEKEYDRHADADADKDKFTNQPQPPVVTSLRVVAMDWIGISEAHETKSEKN